MSISKAESQAKAMTCPKCHGLMVFTKFYDFFDSCHAWRCLNCGAIIDKAIAENRRRMRPVEAHPRTWRKEVLA